MSGPGRNSPPSTAPRPATCCPRAASGPGRNSPPSTAPRPARAGPPAGRATGARAAQDVGPPPHVTDRSGAAMPAQMKLSAITLDRPDPPALAAFYQRATGLEPHPECDADFAGLKTGTGSCPVSSGSTTTGLPTGRTGSFLSSSTSTSTSTTSTRPRHGCSNSVRAGRSTSPGPIAGGSSSTPPGTPSVRWPRADRARTRSGGARRGNRSGQDTALRRGRASRARASCPLCAPGRGIGVGRTAVRSCRTTPVGRPCRGRSRRPPRSPAAPQPRSLAAPQVRGRADRVTGAVFRPHTGMVMGCQVTAKPMEMALAMT